MGSKLSKKKKKKTFKIAKIRVPEVRSDNYEGMWRELPAGEKSYDPRDPSLIFVEEEDVLDFELDDYKSRRALMSCGHAVTPMSLTKWCRRLLDQGLNTFVCGAFECEVVWSFEEVCKMALLTPEELNYFEQKMFSNSKDRLDVKRCPGCRSSVVRTDLLDLCVECTLCTVEKNRFYSFCWQCLREWKGPSPRTDRCGNDGCINTSVETLRNCPDTTFQDIEGIRGCPSVRACPHCGFLIEHNTSGCKHIFCLRCGEEFCFVCLKYSDDCLESSEYFRPCVSGVAPRQTSIPVWQSADSDW